MGQPFPLQIPLLGLNTVDPFVDFGSGYARELTNFSLINGSLPSRPAIRATETANKTVLWKDSGTGLVSNGDVIDMVTGAVSSTVTSMGTQGFPIEIKHASLDLVIGLGAPRLSSTPFTTWTMTVSSIIATNIISACSYNGRLYVCDGSNIEYSDLAQITGAMPSANKFPISQVMKGDTVIGMYAATIQPGNISRTVFVIFGLRGTVLIYDGSYPASSSWQLIGSFMMPPLSSAGGIVEANSDIYVTTTRYAYKLSSLISGGISQAFEERLSRPIDNLWASFNWNLGEIPYIYPETSHSFYYEPLNCLIFQCFEKGQLSLISDYGNEACYLAYFLDYKAWALWMMAPFFAPVRYQNGIYYGGGYSRGITQLSASYLVDQAWNAANTTMTEYDVQSVWKTPYFYPTSGKNRKLNGTVPFFKNTVSGYLHDIKAIYDLSDYNAPYAFMTQSGVTAILPQRYTNGKIDVLAKSSKIYNEFCGIAGDGAGFSMQYNTQRKSGSNAAQTNIIYGASINFEDGAAYPA